MKSQRIAWGILLSGLLLLPTLGQAMSGREIYDKVHAIREQAMDREAAVTMLLIDKAGGRRTRTLIEYGKRQAPSGYKALVIFKSPAELKDVGFLILARTFADRDLWAYLPEYRRVRRIADSARDDSFFGSDFSYDDFGGPDNLDDFTFTLIREEAVDGQDCYLVEVTPKAHRKYSRYLAWVDKGLWVHRKLDYYQGDSLYRSGIFRQIEVIDAIPTPHWAAMENKKSGHRTELSIDSIRYHTSFPDELFSQRSLERAGQ